MKEFEHEQTSNQGNSVDNSPLSVQPEDEVQFKPTLNDECSLEETLKVAQQLIKLSRQHKDKQLKEEEEARVILKQSYSNRRMNYLCGWIDGNI